MDEENKQITGNGAYSYGEPTAEPVEKAKDTGCTESEAGEAGSAEVSQSEKDYEESKINESVQPENTTVETEQNKETSETKSNQDNSNQTQTESTDSQENKFTYQDNHYEYSQQYSQNRNEQLDNSPMDLKDWILTLIVLLIPCVGIVMYFVWAFSSNGNINRRNFCRAQLIIFAALLGIYLVFFVLFGAFAITGAAFY